MATVFNNEQVAHVWAHQNQYEGRSNNGQFYFTGRRLYSYGSHFVAGLALGDCYAAGHVLNADTYSVTTGKHMGYAARATGYDAPTLPNLTSIVDALDSALQSPGTRNAQLRNYLDEYGHRLSERALALILRAMKSKADPAKEMERLEARRAKEIEAQEKEAAKRAADSAAEFAKIPTRILKERLYSGAGSWSHSPERELEKLISELVPAHRHARGKRIKAAVWAHLKALRELKKRGIRTSNMEARAGLATLRRVAAGDYGTTKGGQNGRLPWSHRRAAETVSKATVQVLAANMPPVTRRALERQFRIAGKWAARINEREERESRNRERVRKLRSNVRNILFFRNRMRERLSGIAGAAVTSRTLNSQSNYATDSAEALDLLGRFPQVAANLRALGRALEIEAGRAFDRESAYAEWERQERERVRLLPREERQELWRAGEITSRQLQRGDSDLSQPLLRCLDAETNGCTVTGGTLETSEGASAPLKHAFRVFLAAKACRAAGTAWTAGTRTNGLPKAMRAGSFTLDYIREDGGFKAGCHYIQWPEIERLARQLRLFDCEPETVSELESA